MKNPKGTNYVVHGSEVFVNNMSRIEVMGLALHFTDFSTKKQYEELFALTPEYAREFGQSLIDGADRSEGKECLPN